VLGFAFHRLGLSEGWTLAVLAATVLGGVVNIPVLRLHPDRPVQRVWWTPWGWLLTVESPCPTVVAVVAHRFSRVVPDLGVVLSPLVPVLAAALAYVSGTLGTLVGADLVNLRAVVRSAPPVIAIGGAGTFDGIVLAGVAAVVLVAVL
jgi:uncharacterized membrane protein